MDTLTHIALGAVVGEAQQGKTLGKRAMLWGAVAQNVPDIDFLAALWLQPADNLLAHRGFTHSFLFGIMATAGLALAAARWHRPHNLSLKKWMLFFGMQILIHLLIDSLNAYGSGWFEPFSHYRVSFHTLFVADPFYTVWLVIACLALLLLSRHDRRRKRWITFGLLCSSLYVIYAAYNKLSIEHDVKKYLQQEKSTCRRYLTTPTALNTWLWFVVAEDDSGYHIGHRSVFDDTDSIDLTYFYRRQPLLDSMRHRHEVQKLLRFSQGYYTVEQWGDTLVFNDLRFGQITGWHNPRSRFVFHYFLYPPGNNDLVVQRGRFANWNSETVGSLLRRIEGE